ncbi:MAG TPA: DUF692 domain-containing protein [Holophaga sp.]|nr:DUF692 domain-containing protein [Holophaga sp.]
MGRGGFSGVGVGLRRSHLERVAALPGHGVPFWETCPENVIGEGGRNHRLARAVLERDAVLTHGLSLSVGGFDAWDEDYLGGLRAFLLETGTPWHSEHLCFTSVDGSSLHELLPLPFTREAVAHTVARVKELQARLPVPLILENITYYAELGQGEMDEAAFITEVLEGADSGWLLDINNVYVNALNFGFDPREWLARMPLDRVVQMHIAGHRTFGDLTLDTHGAEVADPVIELMQWALARLGRPVPVLLERDNHIPDLEVLLAERGRIQEAYDAVLAVPGRARA